MCSTCVCACDGESEKTEYVLHVCAPLMVNPGKTVCVPHVCALVMEAECGCNSYLAWRKQEGIIVESL